MRRWTLCLGCLPLVGCMAMDGTWEGQRQALMTNPDTIARTNSLATFAPSAGSIGDAESVRRSLKDLEGDPRHDEVAEQSAIQLSNGGRWFAAIEIAGLIKNDSRRQEALLKIRGW